MTHKKGRRSKKSDMLLLALFLIALLAWLLFTSWRDWRDWRESDSWASTTSTHFVINHKSSAVHYGYVVNGQTYTGRRVRFFERLLYQGIADLEWQHAQRDATEVTVYYAKEAPPRSVLVREIDSGRVVGLLLTLIYCGLALLLPLLWIGLSLWWLRRAFSGEGRISSLAGSSGLRVEHASRLVPGSDR